MKINNFFDKTYNKPYKPKKPSKKTINKKRIIMKIFQESSFLLPLCVKYIKCMKIG